MSVSGRLCVPGKPCTTPALPLPALGRWQARGMAGHSKWANIRHVKALKDGQKQRIVMKCIQMIRRSIKGMCVCVKFTLIIIILIVIIIFSSLQLL